jgi:hypothetical protein
MANKDLEELIERNKEALIQEASRSFNSIVEVLNDIVSEETTGEPAKDLDLVRQQLMALSLNVGFLGAIMNQLIIFITGIVPDDEEGEKPMGFASMMEEVKPKKSKKKKILKRINYE